MAAAAEAHPQPWDPVARAMRVGGGGDPLRDVAGNTVTDLRCQRNSNQVASSEGLPMNPTGEQDVLDALESRTVLNHCSGMGM